MTENVKLLVPSDVAGFAAGSILDTVEQIAAYWRATYSEAKEGATLEHMDDETIVSLASDVEPAMKGENYHDADEYILEVLTALESGGDETPEVEIAEDIRAVAMKVAQSRVIGDWAAKIESGQRDVDAGPAFIAKEMMAVLEPSELAVISWPGSEVAHGNIPPDITKGTRVVAGESKKFTHSKVKDFISLQPRVAALLDQIKKISNRPEGQKENQEEKVAKKNINTSVSALTRAYTLAIKAALLFAHLEDHPHITIEWREEDGDISKWKYCVDVGNKHKVKEYGSFTIAGITKMGPASIPTTMTYQSLIEALKRKKEPTTTTTKYPQPEGVADMDDMLSTVVHALRAPSLWSQLTVALSVRLDADKKNEDAATQADDLIRNLVALSSLASDATKRHMKRYRELQAEDVKKGLVAPPVENQEDDAA